MSEPLWNIDLESELPQEDPPTLRRGRSPAVQGQAPATNAVVTGGDDPCEQQACS